MDNAQLINQTSGEFEYYTDPKIIEAARQVMGSIELDPASSEKANESVKAQKYFGQMWDGSFIDGITRDWRAETVWMNHPFGIKQEACTFTCAKALDNPKHRHHSIDWHGNMAWINKYIREYERGHFKQSMNITYAATSEEWFQPLMNFPQCYLSPRTNYYTPNGELKKGVTKGSVVTYLGSDVEAFHFYFRQFGKIKVLYTSL